MRKGSPVVEWKIFLKKITKVVKLPLKVKSGFNKNDFL
ncbi:MAG: hypothetical protein JWN76_3673 [Chitinophagaceae bacterium]|nr:hypothetical protein [Chitinophagaceae bacterium]